MLWEAMKTDLKREAKHENQIDTAKRMLKRNKYTITEIAEDTGLSIADIKEIQSNL